MSKTNATETGRDTIALDEVVIPGVDTDGREITEDVKYYGPPGCGKSTTMAAHVARIIQETDYTKSDIAWGTYRKELAEETLDRLVSWGIFDEDDLTERAHGATRYIGTLHALGNRSMGVTDAPAEYRHKAAFCYARDIPMANASDETAPGKLLFDVFEWLQNSMLDPSDPAVLETTPLDAIERFNAQRSESISDLWDEWERYKRDEELIDFAEQISIPIDRDISSPRPIVVIDEYHDVNELMATLCEQWVQDAEIAIVAGDRDQVVNEYAGASPTYFNELDLPEQLLDTSWRVPANIWDLSGTILDNAPGHAQPPVSTVSSGSIYTYGSPGEYIRHPDEEAGEVGHWLTPPVKPGHPAQIALEHGDGAHDPDGPGFHTDPDDVLILARTRQQVRGICASLDGTGMLYRTQDGLGGWQSSTHDGARTRTKLFNALEALDGFDPGEAGLISVNGTLDQFIDETAPTTAKTEFAIRPAEAGAMLNAANGRKLSVNADTVDDICDKLAERDENDLVDEIEFFEWTKPSFWDDYTEGARSVQNLNKNAISGRARSSLLNALVRHGGNGPLTDKQIGVEVMTIHASKGHEASDVIVFKGITNKIAEGVRRDKQTRANEYRTWYVACTRTSERLHLVNGGFSWTLALPSEPLADSHVRSFRDDDGGVVADD